MCSAMMNYMWYLLLKNIPPLTPCTASIKTTCLLFSIILQYLLCVALTDKLELGSNFCFHNIFSIYFPEKQGQGLSAIALKVRFNDRFKVRFNVRYKIRFNIKFRFKFNFKVRFKFRFKV